MNKLKTKKNLHIEKLSALIFCFILLLIISPAGASEEREKESEILKEQKIEKERLIEEREKLEKKQEQLGAMLGITGNKKNLLSNQVKLMNLQISSLEKEIATTSEGIKTNETELEILDYEVDERQKELAGRKKELAAMLRFFYQTEKNISISFLSQDSDVSKVLSQSQYIDQASSKLDKLVLETQKSKEELGIKQSKVKEKNQELKEQQEIFEEKVEQLESEELLKKRLLQETQGQEDRYKKLLTRVEAQMKNLIGDLNELSGETRSDLEDIKKSAPKPTSGIASTKWYYAQNDSRWGSRRIGLSNSLMKNYGCAVTAVSMIFTYHKETITPGSLAGKQIFARDLIVWPAAWKNVELDSTTWHGNINWKEIDKSLEKDKPVIVFIRSRNGGGHYVVVHGKDKKGEYVVHDPLFGANIFLETSRKLVGRIYNSSTTVDQMIIYK